MNVKIINNILHSINGGNLIQKAINNINKEKTHYAKNLIYQDVTIGIALCINGDFVRSHYFGKKGKSFETVRKAEAKAIKLIKAPHNICRSIFLNNDNDGEKSLGGALRSNVVVIATAGLKNELQDEYLSWLILNCVERDLNELEDTLGDNRFKSIENHYVVKEIERLIKFNLK
ncbi:MAG: hypothetical protein KGI58_00640 [Patescibacteria group bacterium]|nr:hypothetical protein [Patescibacteria group bacterium]